MRPFLPGIVFWFLSVLAMRSAVAQPTDQRAVDARAACAAGKVEKGIEILAQILATTDDIMAIYNMGRCYQQNGHPDKAVLQFEEYLRKAKGLPPEEKSVVEAHLAEARAVAKRQQAVVPPPMEVAPTGLGKDAARQPAPPNVVSGLATPVTGDGGRNKKLRLAGLGTASVGVLSLGTGLFFSLRTTSLDGDMEKAENRFDPANDKVGSRAETLQWVFYGVGAALLAGGGVLYYLGLDRNESVALVPSISSRGAGAMLRVRL